MGSAVLVRLLERRAIDASLEASTPARREFLRDAALALGFFLLPSVLFVAIIFAAGTFHPFVHEGLAALFGYIGIANTPSLPLLTRLSSLGTYVVYYPLFAFLWAFAGMYGWAGRLGSSKGGQAIRLAAWSLPVLSSVVTLGVLPAVLPHYANIVYAACMFSAIIGSRIARTTTVSSDQVHGQRVIIGATAAFATIVIVLTLSGTVWANVNFIGSYVRSTFSSHRLTAVDPYLVGTSNLPELCPSASAVLVWGRASQLYADLDWEPASRYVTTVWQTSVSTNQGYYRKVLLQELERQPPTCILEAAGALSYGVPASTDDIEAEVPGSGRFISRCYSPRTTTVGLSLLGQDPELNQSVTVYVRRKMCVSSPPR